MSTVASAGVKTRHLATAAGGQSSGLFRSFCTSQPSVPLQAAPAGLGIAAWVWSRMPRLRSESSPSRSSLRSRNQPSPLFRRPSPNSGGSGGSGGDPRRRPGPSWLASFTARIDERFWSRFDARAVILAVIGVNTLVFVGWAWARENMQRFADPRAMITMSKNFLSGEINMREGRWWTLLTSCFSHEAPMHLLFNMVTLGFMSPPVVALTGPTMFLVLYCGGGIISSVVSMVGKRVFETEEQRRRRPFSHGASGSVYAIMSTFACVQPRAQFLLFFVLPLPAWACVSGIFAWDVAQAVLNPGQRTDSAGHIGGVMAGILFWRFGLKGIQMH